MAYIIIRRGKHQFGSHKRIKRLCKAWRASQVALVVKNTSASAGDVRDAGLILGMGRSPGGGHGNPLQYSCLENPHGQRSLVGCSPSVESQRVRHDWATKCSTAYIESTYFLPDEHSLIYDIWVSCTNIYSILFFNVSNLLKVVVYLFISSSKVWVIRSCWHC